MSETLFDVFTHPAGAALEASIAAAVKVFRVRHQCEPAAVWLSPRLPDVAADGLEVKRGRHMSPWYVYLEVPGGRQAALPLRPDGVVDEVADETVDELEEREDLLPAQLALF